MVKTNNKRNGKLKKEIYNYLLSCDKPVTLKRIFIEFEFYTDREIQFVLDELFENKFIMYPSSSKISIYKTAGQIAEEKDLLRKIYNRTPAISKAYTFKQWMMKKELKEAKRKLELLDYILIHNDEWSCSTYQYLVDQGVIDDDR